jgi:hypothetical protein
MSCKKRCFVNSHVGRVPKSVVFTTTESILYEMTAVTVPSDLFTVDPTTGTATLVGDTGQVNILAIAVDITDHVMYGINSTPLFPSGFTPTLYTIDKTTGIATFLTNITGLTSNLELITDITITSQGAAFIVTIIPGTSGINVYHLDLISGLATFYFSITTPDNLIQASIATNDYSFFITTTDTTFVSTLYETNIITTTTLPITLVGFPPLLFSITGIVHDPTNGATYITAVNVSTGIAYLASLNLSNGVATVIGPTAARSSALAVDVVTTTNLRLLPDNPGVSIDLGPCCN